MLRFRSCGVSATGASSGLRGKVLEEESQVMESLTSPVPVPIDESFMHAILAIEHLSFEAPWSSLDFQLVFDNPKALCLGLSLNRKLIGYAIGYLEQPSFHLANLAIDPHHRRSGNALLLATRVMENATALGCTACTLEVRTSNQGALQLYSKLGFEVVDMWPHFYSRPAEDAFVMYRGLTAGG